MTEKAPQTLPKRGLAAVARIAISRRSSGRLTRYALGIAVVGMLGATSTLAQIEPSEPFFPHSGDPRYNVAHYDAHLTYMPASGLLQAKDTIEATPLEPLTEFSLDFDHLHVGSVTVDGEPAAFSLTRSKLLIDPPAPLPTGMPFVVSVRYHGHPGAVFEPNGASGWFRSRDGAAAVGESLGTPAWLPCNNALADKASFDFYLNVPASREGIANGRLLGVRRRGKRKTFHWQESQPMDAYLAVIDIGRGRLVRGKAAGVPTWTLVDPALVSKWKPRLAEVPEILRFETKLLGPYPFDAAGSIVDRFGYGAAIESQTRPIYDLPPLRTAIVHELAHQWFGDSVGLRRWSDIWLNEGFASWVQWYYRERHGGPLRKAGLQAADAQVKPDFRNLESSTGATWEGLTPLHSLGLRTRRNDIGGAPHQGRDGDDAEDPPRLGQRTPLQQRRDGRIHHPRRRSLWAPSALALQSLAF